MGDGWWWWWWWCMITLSFGWTHFEGKTKGIEWRCLEATNSREDFGDINSAWRAGWDSRKTQSQIPAVSGSPVCQSIAPKWSKDRLNTSRKSHQSDGKGNCIALKLEYLWCWMPIFLRPLASSWQKLFLKTQLPAWCMTWRDTALDSWDGFPQEMAPSLGPSLGPTMPVLKVGHGKMKQRGFHCLAEIYQQMGQTTSTKLRSHPAFQGCQGARAHGQPQPLLLFCWFCEPKYAAVVNLAYPTGLHGRQNAPCAGDWG